MSNWWYGLMRDLGVEYVLLKTATTVKVKRVKYLGDLRYVTYLNDICELLEDGTVNGPDYVLAWRNIR